MSNSQMPNGSLRPSNNGYNNNSLPPVICRMCGDYCWDGNAALIHEHDTHQVLYTPQCPCSTCAELRGLGFFEPAVTSQNQSVDGYLDQQHAGASQQGGITANSGVPSQQLPNFAQPNYALYGQNVFIDATNVFGRSNVVQSNGIGNPIGVQNSFAPNGMPSAAGLSVHPNYHPLQNDAPFGAPRTAAGTQQGSMGFNYPSKPQGQPGLNFGQTMTMHQPALQPMHQADIIAENNLPIFIGKIEVGKFERHPKKEDEMAWVARRTEGSYLYNAQGYVLGPNTGKKMRQYVFLPDRIPENVEGWQIGYWLRKGSETEQFVGLDDIIDRIVFSNPNAKRKNHTTISMRMQRYIQKVGQLATVEKSHGGLPAQWAMDTIAHLDILHAKLNTWWELNNNTAKGPWIATQPRNHPAYTKGVSQDHAGGQYIIEKMYGLSERVRRVSDGMIFLDILANEAGLAESADRRKKSRKMTAQDDNGDGDDAQDLKELVAQFELFRKGGRRPEITHTLCESALENATSENEVLAVLWGDTNMINTLQVPPATANAPGATTAPSLWSQLTNERLAFLKAIARNLANETYLNVDIAAWEDWWQNLGRTPINEAMGGLQQEDLDQAAWN